jgi:hypothetical protein
LLFASRLNLWPVFVTPATLDPFGTGTPEEIDEAIDVFIVAALCFKLLQRGKRVHPQVSGFF